MGDRGRRGVYEGSDRVRRPVERTYHREKNSKTERGWGGDGRGGGGRKIEMVRGEEQEKGVLSRFQNEGGGENARKNIFSRGNSKTKRGRKSQC